MVTHITLAMLYIAAGALAAPETEPAWISVFPSPGTPGGHVTVQVSCAEPSPGPVVSQALRLTTPLAPHPDGHQPWALFADAVIADVRPGTYPVQFTCGPFQADAKITVVTRAQVPQKPKGAPETGDGSTAR